MKSPKTGMKTARRICSTSGSSSFPFSPQLSTDAARAKPAPGSLHPSPTPAGFSVPAEQAAPRHAAVRPYSSVARVARPDSVQPGSDTAAP